MGKKTPKGAYGFDAANLVEGLHADGYDTWCVGGVAFFDKRSELGRVFPSFFEKSYWNPSFSCPVKESTANQVDFLLRKIQRRPSGHWLHPSLKSAQNGFRRNW